MKKINLKFGYVCLYASDYKKSAEFYRDILGLEPVYPDRDLDNSDFYAFRTGSTILAIEPGGSKKNMQKDKSENPVLLQFPTESIEELEEINQYLESKRVKFINRSKDMSYGIITNILDPDGNLIEILFFKEGKDDH